MTTANRQPHLDSARLRRHLWLLALTPFATAAVIFGGGCVALLPLVDRSARLIFVAVAVAAVCSIGVGGRKWVGRVAAETVIACEGLIYPSGSVVKAADKAAAYREASWARSRLLTSKGRGPIPRLPEQVKRTIEDALRSDTDAGLTAPSPETIALLKGVVAAHERWMDALDLTSVREKLAALPRS